MKRILLTIFALVLISKIAFAQGICSPAANIIIYSNYDGGTLNINVDDNVPDLKIGLCSYEALSVNITGAYAGNVSEVFWAGYTISGTSVIGVDAGIVELLQYPPVTLYDVDGNQNMVCAYECDTAYVPGGCNTVDQATDFFLTNFDGDLRYSYFQYGVWNGTYNTSDGGNCCAFSGCSATVFASKDVAVCEGAELILSATGGGTYTWYADGIAIDCPGPCQQIEITATETTAYTVTGTNADGCTGTDEVMVVVNPAPEIGAMFDGTVIYASGGISYQWYLDGVAIDGATTNLYVPSESGDYTVVGMGANGCEGTSEVVSVIINIINEMISDPVFSLYPNPADETLHVGVMSKASAECPVGEPLLYFSKNVLLSYTILNSSGKILTQGNSSSFFNHAFEISTSFLPNGFYLLEFDAEGKKMHMKFCVQH